MSDTMRDAFEIVWPYIAAELPCHQREGYSASDVESAEKNAAWETWQFALKSRAAQSQPAPPVPSDVQEIMRLMNPYVRACAGFDASIDELDDAKAEIAEAYKPLEAALAALVDDNHRLKFELDGVREMRGPEWQPIETAPKDGTEILLYAGPQTFEGKPVSERNTSGHWQTWEKVASEYHATTGEYLGRSVQDSGEGWLSWDGGFTEENPPTHWMPRPPPPTHGIEPEQGGNHG